MKTKFGTSFEEYGQPDGLPLIYCHGSPGSHYEATKFDDAAKLKGIRIIAFDRPGFGKSDFRKLKNVANEVEIVMQLADELGLNKFAIMGLSGGAATALATAALIPERVTFCASFVGWAPVAQVPELQVHLAKADRIFLRLAKYTPFIFNWGFSYLGFQLGRGEKQLLSLLKSSLSKVDLKALENDPDVFDFLNQDLQFAFSQGAKGPAQDAYLRYSDWGFDLRKISSQVHIYGAAQDRFAPIEFARTVNTLIPESTLTVYEADGHLTAYRHFEDVAKDMIKTTR